MTNRKHSVYLFDQNLERPGGDPANLLRRNDRHASLSGAGHTHDEVSTPANSEVGTVSQEQTLEN